MRHWEINKFIAYKDVAYIRGLTVGDKNLLITV